MATVFAVLKHALINAKMGIVRVLLSIGVFVIWDGRVHHVRFHVVVIIIPPVQKVLASVMSVNIGLKVKLSSNVA